MGTGCISDYYFTNNEIFNSGDVITYHASNNIQNNALFQVKSGADVTLLAGNSITLNPGFKVEFGATFEARIEPCDNGATLKFASIGMNENVYESTIIKNSEQIVNPAIFNIFPNPTNSDFSVLYSNDSETYVKFEIYDISGVKIKTLLDLDKQNEGNHYYNFSICDLKIGTYLLVFSNSSKTITSKIIKN